VNWNVSLKCCYQIKINQNRFRLGLRPRLCWRGAYSAPPDTLAGFKGFTSKGREGESGRGKEKRGGEDRGEEGRAGLCLAFVCFPPNG